ncbi:MAG: aminotransferase class V-fold PLP-dependent enzyme [Lachnospiraceae bacterium]|nr:aminotransferase class V-fold PLP-dependent enzyme [Lachnospiraceae bacterium]
MKKEYIYMDHAATTWKKPPEVIRAVTDAMEHASGNPGRGGHEVSAEAAGGGRSFPF